MPGGAADAAAVPAATRLEDPRAGGEGPRSVYYILYVLYITAAHVAYGADAVCLVTTPQGYMPRTLLSSNPGYIHLALVVNHIIEETGALLS